MTIGVVIPCRNEAGRVGDLLNALAAQTRRVAEIIVVDDRSTDATPDVVRRWTEAHPDHVVRMVTGPGRGPGPAMNAGICRASSDTIVRLDGHSVPAPTYVEYASAVLDETGAGVAGGVWDIRPGASSTIARAIAVVVSHPLGSGGALYRHAGASGPDRVEVETVPFGVFRRALWEQLGGFDEALAANEDYDFNYRVRQAGFHVVLDRRVRATYFARPTLAALGRQYGRYGFWKRQMLRKDPRALHWRQIPPVAVVPWVVLTAGWAALAPGLVSGLAAAAYPVLLLGVGMQCAQRGANPLAAAAALATVHLAWGTGFWRGVVSRRPGPAAPPVSPPADTRRS